MSNFLTALVGFILFFAVFYGATKLLGRAFRNHTEQEEPKNQSEPEDVKNAD